MRGAHSRAGRLSLSGATLRLAYRQLIGSVDPASPWLEAGAVDARFAGPMGSPGRLTPASPGSSGGVVCRGPSDLVELHEVIDDLFGVGCFDRPSPAGAGNGLDGAEGANGAPVGEVASARLVIARPAVVMPFLEALRPRLEHRGPAFWTWKTARETIATRLGALDSITVEAARLGALPD